MSSSENSSFLLASNPDFSQANIDEEIDSLPSSDDDDDSTVADSEEFHSDAEKQWRESLQQLELLLTMVVVPYIGKYFGRKAAYYGKIPICLQNDWVLMVSRMGTVYGMDASCTSRGIG